MRVESGEPRPSDSGSAEVELSVVMPAYRCADTIASDVRNLERAIASEVISYEIVVVVDGDGDGTFEAAASAQSDRVRVTGYRENQGKGFAVVYGMRQARGRLVGFMDAGGDISPDVWKVILAIQRGTDADVVVGSKRHPKSKVAYPAMRHLYSLGAQLLTWVLFRFNVKDTQTGVKLYRREVVDVVIPLVLIKRFAFDVEILALARHFGFRNIVEAPVEIDYNFASTVNLRAVFRTLWDTVAVFYRLYIRHYYDRARAELETASDLVAKWP